jgi:glycerol-3-phosphate acyltransferase PlsY
MRPGRTVRLVRERVRELATYRRDIRRSGRRLLSDLVVVAVVVLVGLTAALGAGYAILFAVGGGGTLAVVLGWVAAFAIVVTIPVLVMRLASLIYGRLEPR